MKVTFSTTKPTESGNYFLRSKGWMRQVYVERGQKTSSWFDFPFDFGLFVKFTNSYGNTETIPIEWIYGEWSEKIEF